MRTETATSTIYKFDELSDKGKERAREWWRSKLLEDSFWYEYVIEDAANIADILGIDLRQRPVKLMNGSTRYDPAIYWRGFWSQGDGACFEGYYRYKKGSCKAIRECAPQDAELHRIADRLQAIQKPFFYRLVASMAHVGPYYHAYSMSVDVEYSGDDYREKGFVDAEAELIELMQDFANWIYRQLEREYDYQNADDSVDEILRINEYEFTEDGEIA